MKLNELNKNIKQGNSLISDKTIDTKNAFDWDKEFPYKFDIVIGNPPWISIKGKHKSIDISEEELNYYFKTYNCDTYLNSSDFSWFYVKKDLFEMFNRIRKQKGIIQLFEFSNIKTTSGCGAKSHLISNEKINERQIQILKGESINKYVTLKKLWFNFEKRNLSGRTTNQE